MGSGPLTRYCGEVHAGICVVVKGVAAVVNHSWTVVAESLAVYV